MDIACRPVGTGTDIQESKLIVQDDCHITALVVLGRQITQIGNSVGESK